MRLRGIWQVDNERSQSPLEVVGGSAEVMVIVIQEVVQAEARPAPEVVLDMKALALGRQVGGKSFTDKSVYGLG